MISEEQMEGIWATLTETFPPGTDIQIIYRGHGTPIVMVLARNEEIKGLIDLVGEEYEQGGNIIVMKKN